jgi:hypothetical protein
MFFSSYSSKVYYLTTSQRDKKYGVFGYLALIDSGLLNQEAVVPLLVSLIKLTSGNQMIPAGISVPTQSLPEDNDNYRF